MNALVCALLKHDVRVRWIGAVRGTWCEDCGHLWTPDPRLDSPNSTSPVDPPHGRRAAQAV